MNLPNFITIGRIFLVPLTIWLIISDAYGLAFMTFVVAGVSDGIDGYLARRLNIRTELGAYLDPLADKALLVSVYITLGLLKELPAWLVIAVVSRDVLIVSGIILSWLLGKPMRVAPLMISKLNTTIQIILIVAVLGAKALDRDFGQLIWWGAIVAGVLTAASALAYVVAWLRHMAQDQNEEPDA
ncbi:MAG: CDP-alcohol phosphatidyltransferase family protein [Alphaproteobacteria bacterium]|nr:CDP-alcohol phosphatidyltransferase family protein [Alphaproteobacteria bacterium]